MRFPCFPFAAAAVTTLSAADNDIAVIVGCLLPFYSVLARRPTGRSFGSSNNRYHGFPDENTGSIPLRSAVSKVSFSTKIHSSSRSRPADRTPTESLTEILDTDDYDLSSTKTIHVRQDYVSLISNLAPIDTIR